MRTQMITRYTLCLLTAGVLSACSSSDPARSGATGGSAWRSSDCFGNRSSCMYEGHYESDERSYAEEEAKRLNRAALQRLRRGG